MSDLNDIIREPVMPEIESIFAEIKLCQVQLQGTLELMKSGYHPEYHEAAFETALRLRDLTNQLTEPLEKAFNENRRNNKST